MPTSAPPFAPPSAPTSAIEALRQTLITRPRRVMTRERRAAVLVPLIDDGGPLRLLLTLRTEKLPTHAGQVAFPGGGVDEGDADCTAAALREAHEEIGLPPERVEVLGWLDDFVTVHGTTTVTPVVGRVVDLPPLRPDPREVARVFEIPIAALRVAEAWTVGEAPFEGRSYPIYFFPYAGETLWGLSAYITLHFLSLTPGGPPFELPDVKLGTRRRRG